MMIIQFSLCLSSVFPLIIIGIDPTTTTVDPKHELLTEIAGRYWFCQGNEMIIIRLFRLDID